MGDSFSARLENEGLPIERLRYTEQSKSELGHLASGQDGDKWAAGERADYDVPRGLITVTGNPRARQKDNHMKATKFIIDLPADVIRGENVELIVNPEDLPKKK